MKKKSDPENIRAIYQGESTMLGRFGQVETGQEIFLKKSEWDFIQRKGDGALFAQVELEEVKITGKGIVPPTDALPVEPVEPVGSVEGSEDAGEGIDTPAEAEEAQEAPAETPRVRSRGKGKK